MWPWRRPLWADLLVPEPDEVSRQAADLAAEYRAEAERVAALGGPTMLLGAVIVDEDDDRRRRLDALFADVYEQHRRDGGGGPVVFL